MAEGAGRRWLRLVWRPLLVASLAALFGWLLLRGAPSRRRSADPEPHATVAVPAEAKKWAPREQKAPAPGCTPEASKTCVDGDAWWVDSCGTTYAIAQECGDSRCSEGECEAAGAPGCGDVTALGSCKRDVAKICQVDRVMEVDCHAKGQRCVMTGEGPICRERSPQDCPPFAQPVCVGETLRRCEEGVWREFDCDAVGGTCLQQRDRGPARCVYALPPGGDECGACGCPPEPTAEVCNGRDDDLDLAIDEDATCAPVPIVAFVVTDGGGAGSYTDDDVQAAVTELDAAFVREDGFGLSFELREVVRIADPALLELDMKGVDRMLRAGMLTVESDEFYAPVVFTDVVLAEGVPRPGISTVPNGVCGGQRRVWQRQPPVGLVAIAKTRWPTTLAHEMGHFLGLCHTHEAPPPVEQVSSSGELTEAASCETRCEDDPDGLCDTSLDPGPEQCTVDEACAIRCVGGARPDPRNMMAYYPPCRTMFSEEQALLMRQSLALRRGWHRCTGGDGCECTPEASSCPEAMTCRPYVGTGDGDTRWRCDLDGAALPGGRCQEGGECGGGSICVHTPNGEGHCARTCGPGKPACDCKPIDSPQASVCAEDLKLEG